MHFIICLLFTLWVWLNVKATRTSDCEKSPGIKKNSAGMDKDWRDYTFRFSCDYTPEQILRVLSVDEVKEDG